MAATIQFLQFSLLLGFLVGFLSPIGCHARGSLFVFGDANVDAGNNIFINTTIGYRANFYPYGETFFNRSTGRPCDGRIIPDFIAGYAKLPLIPPYLDPRYHRIDNGVNFASSGAGALDETLPGLVINLKTQLSYFKDIEKQLINKFGDQKAKQVLMNAVYLFDIGSNDYVTPYFQNSTFFNSYTRLDYVKMVVGNITAVIQEIYASGGRKFGIMSAGNLGCLPVCRARVTNGGCIRKLAVYSRLHNAVLLDSLQNLQKQLNGFTYSYFRLFAAASDRMDNPSAYGLEVGKSACCGSGPFRGINTCGGNRGPYQLCKNPRKYLFFDGGHPSEIANQQYSDLLWSGDTNFTIPINVKSLFEHVI